MAQPAPETGPAAQGTTGLGSGKGAGTSACAAREACSGPESCSVARATAPHAGATNATGPANKRAGLGSGPSAANVVHVGAGADVKVVAERPWAAGAAGGSALDAGSRAECCRVAWAAGPPPAETPTRAALTAASTRASAAKAAGHQGAAPSLPGTDRRSGMRPSGGAAASPPAPAELDPRAGPSMPGLGRAVPGEGLPAMPSTTRHVPVLPGARAAATGGVWVGPGEGGWHSPAGGGGTVLGPLAQGAMCGGADCLRRGSVLGRGRLVKVGSGVATGPAGGGRCGTSGVEGWRWRWHWREEEGPRGAQVEGPGWGLKGGGAWQPAARAQTPVCTGGPGESAAGADCRAPNAWEDGGSAAIGPPEAACGPESGPVRRAADVPEARKSMSTALTAASRRDSAANAAGH